MNLLRNLLIALVCIALCQAIGGLGAIVTIPAIPSWYAGLIKPPLTPPDRIFGPVWTALYALMGLTLCLLVISRAPQRARAIRAFTVQLALNALWSPVFFGARRPGAALAVIAALWAAVVWTIRESAKVSRPAAWLLAPYLAWISFAAYLNAGIFYLNR
jgi:tryptophan-rich sensory protein